MSVLTFHNVGQSFGATTFLSGSRAAFPAGTDRPRRAERNWQDDLAAHPGRRAPADRGQRSRGQGNADRVPAAGGGARLCRHENTVYEEMLTAFAGLRAQEDRLRQMEAQMATEDVSEDLLARYGALQEAFELAGGYDYPVRIQQVLTGLGFAPAQHHMPLAHCSGGQKTRALLARLLLERPDLLVLDEPTNHLDVTAVEWLEDTLRAWEGALLIVSHDRYFLDKVTNVIWEMSRNGLETYRGNYSAYLLQREERWRGATSSSRPPRSGFSRTWTLSSETSPVPALPVRRRDVCAG